MEFSNKEKERIDAYLKKLENKALIQSVQEKTRPQSEELYLQHNILQKDLSFQEEAKDKQTDAGYVHQKAIIGFRAFTERNHVLRSSGQGQTNWNKGINRATCFKKHAAPHPHCKCGLYAFHHLPKLWRLLGPQLALVAARGNLEVHKTGFRAEEMQVLALYSSPYSFKRKKKKTERIAKRYQVPVISSRKELLEYGQGLGESVPKQFMP